MAHRKAAAGQPVITSEEWLKELEQYQRKDDSGQTSRELSKMWGCSVEITRFRLRELQERGKLVVGFRREMRLDRRPHNVAVYSLKP